MPARRGDDAGVAISAAPPRANMQRRTLTLPSNSLPPYPVSSYSSLSAAVSADSVPSMRPAGSSTQTAAAGGRNCRMMGIESGRLGCLTVKAKV